MIVQTIGSATEVYGNAGRCEIVRHFVDDADLAETSRSLRSLANSIGAEAEDEYWRQTLGPIRKLAFAFCSVPLPFSLSAKAAGTDWTKVRHQVRLCEQMFPDAHKSLATIAERLEQLSARDDSPLIPPLQDLLDSSASLSVLIRNPRMNQAASAYFSGNSKLRHVRVVSATQLRGACACDVLATIGPCAWFPEYVFTAPRAGTIHVLSFRWIRDGWKPGPVLLHTAENGGSTNPSHRIGALPRISDKSPAVPQTSADVEPDELLPPLPALTRSAIQFTAAHSENTEERVPARLCHLAGNRAVFVAADEGATSLVIDTSESGSTSVWRAPSEELEPGFYLLLRTSGGGDFIAPLADHILGKMAATRRSQQAEWKRCLIEKASERFGALTRQELASRLASELRLQQQSHAKPANVHYWLTAKCISPRKPEDFAAIMRFAGLENRTDELWAAMADIDRAHKQAGFLIRRMLLEKITATSLEPLERDGEMVFDLGEEDGGTLTAFLITAIHDEELEVPADRIGVLLDTEE